MKKLKSNNGITLIALIITIIILLILAVVSIRLVINGGILDKSKNAVSKYSEAEMQEKIQLAYTDYQMGKLSNENYTFEQALANAGITYKSLTGNDSDGYTIVVETKDGEKTYTISSSGVSIEEPFSAEEWDKTATDEKYFTWGSDDPNDPMYSRLTGVNEEFASELPQDIIIPSRCMDIYHCAFSPSTSIGAAHDTYNEDTMASINNIKSVRIPDTVVSLGARSFQGCENLKKVQLSNNIPQLQVQVFKNCINLATINIPSSVTYIGGDAFSGTGFEYIEIPGNVRQISIGAFCYCKQLKSVRIKEGVEVISDGVFAYDDNLENIEIPQSITTIGSQTIVGTAIYNNAPNNSLIYVGDVLFGYKGIAPEGTTIQVEEGTRLIVCNALTFNSFYTNCNEIVNIEIPNSVTGIGSSAFSGLSNLSKITIHKLENSIKGAPWGASSTTTIEWVGE